MKIILFTLQSGKSIFIVKDLKIGCVATCYTKQFPSQKSHLNEPYE